MTRLEDLSPEQQDVVSVWGRGLAILAGAGSGKTTTLVVKCDELLKREPEARFAAVSFTERSAADLREKLEQRLPLTGESGPLSGHWVMTIHGLCGAILREFPREAGFDGEEGVLSEPQSRLLWERALEALWLDDLPPEVEAALELLLDRDSQDGVSQLLQRARALKPFGLLEKLGAQEDPAARALATVGRFTLERYDRLKRRQGALDFDDLEAGADRALGHAAVREAFHKRFNLVLVDEFQDTNPTQAAIILRFARPDRSNLCVVGDPKQSIYRFRDADVTLFEEFCAGLPEKRSLTWNFRSRPGIIELANRVCAPAFEASALNYEPLVPRRETEGDAVVRIDVREPADLAAWIAGERERGVPLHEMALLLRKVRGGNEKWLKALTTAGIPMALGSGGFFWEDPRVRELVALLRWWDDPGNTLSAAVFLRAPWVGVSDRELDAWLAAGATGPGLEPSFHASGNAIGRALAPLRPRLVRPGELLLALLVSETVEDEIGSPLLGLWHRCEDLSSRGLDFHAIVQDLALAVSEGRREREVPPPQNQGQLRVLTLHASKGLEFPHVILVDLGKKPRSPNAPNLFWDRERGPYLSPRDLDGERNPKDPVEAAWRKLERDREIAESKRVFYVALTRARERLILACPEREDPIPEASLAYASDDWRAWLELGAGEIPVQEIPKGRPHFLVAPLRQPRNAPPSPKGGDDLLRPRHSVTEWTTLSRCERSYEWRYIRPVAAPPSHLAAELPQEAPGDDDTLSARELGIKVHACLEHADYEGLKELEERVGRERFSAAPVEEWARGSEWMAPSGPGRDVRAELAFEIPVGKDVLVGAIDRLVVKNGGFTIVDFKVTAKPKSADALLETYRLQLELYAWAIRKLEPELEQAHADAALVNISSKGVAAVPVTLTQNFDPALLAARAAAIVGGALGAPRPGTLCGSCEFRSRCPEGMLKSRNG